MKILYSPQRNDEIISYKFDTDRIHVAFRNKVDTFNFTNFPEGAILTNINTVLDINPITSVKREGGVLYIKILYFYGEDANEEELFPTWKEV